jgi:BirA family biotin operon repressor/biotin-[acetyl-CoA-carboxylase] ligase
MFDLSRILRSSLVRHVDHHPSIGSTSDRALELAARDGAPLPLLVLADRQTSGRGRGTNRWWSAEGALTFSLALDAAVLSADQRPTVALVAGLAVCEALEQLAPRAEWRVKWPNDVFAGGGKACGILCESVPGWPARLVVGVGINVNNSLRGQRSEVGGQKSEVTSEGIPPGAVALVDLDGLARDLTDVLLAVLDRLDLRLRDLTGDGFAALAAEYRRRCFLTGRTLTATAGSEKLVGHCRGIDDRGALVLATPLGLCTLVAGSIDAWE